MSEAISGTALPGLRDAAMHARGLLKSEHDAPHWRTATELLPDRTAKPKLLVLGGGSTDRGALFSPTAKTESPERPVIGQQPDC
jgi:hypothetical protein